MTPDIERAVDAMVEADGGEHWTLFTPRDFARNMVIAVLEALAEPSEKVVEQAFQAICELGPGMAAKRSTIRAALRAARLAELGRTE